MSIINDLMSAAKEIELAKIQRPREVQTIQQNQVPLDNNVQARQVTAGNATPALTGLMSKVPGGNKTLIGFGLLLVGGFIYKKVL